MTLPSSVRRDRPGNMGMARPLLMLLALILVSTNLRPAITTVAAVMPEIEQRFGLEPQLMPLLGGLPVLAFGVSAPLGPWLASRMGAGRAVALALLVLAGALLLRALGPAMLLPGTFLAGSAIMTASVLVPQILKAHGGTGWWTGLCTMGFGVGAAMGAGLMRPLEQILNGSLPWALALWAVPALLAGGLMLRTGEGTVPGRSNPVVHHRGAAAALRTLERQTKQRRTLERRTAGRGKAEPGSARPAPLWRHRTALAVAAFFGLQAMLYFAVTSWLSAFLLSRGVEPANAAVLLAWFSIAGLPASLLSPVMASRPAILKIITPGLGVLIAAGLLGVLMAPAGLQFWAVGLLGAVQSAGFGLGMALMVLRSSGPLNAGRLSAMSQGSGFALASLGPLLAGMLQQLTGGWETSFMVLAGVALLLAVAGRFASTGPNIGGSGEAKYRLPDARLPGSGRSGTRQERCHGGEDAESLPEAEMATAGSAVETAEPAKGS
ncbi:MFS transporter [Pseudarthrobacter sp. N5]|uniref:MFS transporter n=1 Tax=Pseudarthrobacter sp. N5 TaxID=3418416 RepID=UPI003CECF3DC